VFPRDSLASHLTTQTQRQETFEFLNILQAHGFPKIMGVLTHLDRFRDNKKLTKTKKRLKQRFWTEIYQGAKLFYLSGLVNGRYPKGEILNLSRFISVMKFRPLVWRNTHPYVLVDRMEDLTAPEQVRQHPKMDRTVTLYGYTRGTNLKPGARVHIPGVGDTAISHISTLPDPCPIPDKQRKMLNEKHKLLYAPMCDVSGILYDKDAIYVQVPGVYSRGKAMGEEGKDVEGEAAMPAPMPAGPGEQMVMNLQDSKFTIADKLTDAQLRIFGSSASIRADEYVSAVADDDDEEEELASD
jgi:ribosome biogenesis protein BMS1